AVLSCLICSDSSLTNFSAFMLGSFTVLPAVEYFCLYAGTAILFDFILQVPPLKHERVGAKTLFCGRAVVLTGHRTVPLVVR
ncbi:unnamed protein product, partial [Laminaria digitata]